LKSASSWVTTRRPWALQALDPQMTAFHAYVAAGVLGEGRGGLDLVGLQLSGGREPLHRRGRGGVERDVAQLEVEAADRGGAAFGVGGVADRQGAADDGEARDAEVEAGAAFGRRRHFRRRRR
jgi:hypothetical protein